MSLTSNITARPLPKSVNDSVEHLSDKVQDALDAVHTQVDQAFSQMGNGVDDLANATPGLLHAANGQLKQIALKSASMAKGLSDAAKAKALVAADHTSERIRKDPLKSVLIAVAAGAALTAVATIAYKRRQSK